MPAAQSKHEDPISARPHGQRNFLGDYDSLFKAMQLDYVDNARYASSGYSEFIGKLYTLNASMFQSPVFCDRTLTQMMLHYLLWYQDPAIQLLVGPGAAWHVRPGLKVQRFGDALYVTAVEGDIVADRDVPPIETGDRIIKINGMTLDELRDEVERTLSTTVEPADPEREDWSTVLAFARHLTLVDAEGRERTVKIATGTSDRDKYLHPTRDATTGSDETHVVDGARSCPLEVREGVALLSPRFAAPDFSSDAPAVVCEISRLAGEGAIEHVLIDLRGVRGGEQQHAYPLVPLVLAPGAVCPPQDLFGPAGIVMNYSRRNVDAKLAELQGIRPTVANDPESLAELDTLIDEFETKRGRGFQRDMTDYYPGEPFTSCFSRSESAPRVTLLVDRHTGDAAEWLVRAAKSAKHARVVGRSTEGSLDNTCPRVVRLDEDFSVVIPTAKYVAALEGMATLGRGIEPDIHVPWTPEHLARDVDLDAALS